MRPEFLWICSHAIDDATQSFNRLVYKTEIELDMMTISLSSWAIPKLTLRHCQVDALTI